MGCMVKVYNKYNEFVGYFGWKYNKTGEVSKRLVITDNIAYAWLYGDKSTVNLATYIKNTNGKYKNYKISLEWDGRGLNPEEIKFSNVENIDCVKSSNKRKYNLPKYVCWDIRNTVAADKVWFGVTITKNGKKTNTAAKTVREAMQYVVENRLSEGLWTEKQAEEYLNTYKPEMENGYSVELAKQTSKSSKNVLLEKEEEKIATTQNVTPRKRMYNLPKYICYDKAESRNRECTVFQTQLRINGKLCKNNLYTVKDALIYNVKLMLDHTDIWSLDKIAEYIKSYDPEMENGNFIPSNTPKSPSVRKREKNKNIRLLREKVTEKLQELNKFAKENDISIDINIK